MASSNKDRGNFVEQCFIKDFMPFFSGIHGKNFNDYDSSIKIKHSIISEPRNILKVDRLDLNKDFALSKDNQANEGSISFISKLSSPYAQKLMESVPKELMSNLQPQIRIYKIYYRGPDDKEGIEIEFPFNNFLNPSEHSGLKKSWEQDQYYSGTNEALPGHLAVGLKEFSFDYLGTNPAEVDYYINVHMKLWFSTVDAMFHKYPLPERVKEKIGKGWAFPADSPAHDAKKETISFADLITRPTWGYSSDDDRSAHLAWDPKYFRIRVDIGYSPPTKSFLEEACRELASVGTSQEVLKNQLYDAIDSVKASFFLNILRHTFGFRPDVPSSPFEVDITYNGAVESALYSPDANILKADIDDKQLVKLKKESPAYQDMAALAGDIFDEYGFQPHEHDYSTFFQQKTGRGANTYTRSDEEVREKLGIDQPIFPSDKLRYRSGGSALNPHFHPAGVRKKHRLKSWGNKAADQLHAYYTYKRRWQKELNNVGLSEAQITNRRYTRIFRELSGIYIKKKVNGKQKIVKVIRHSRIYSMKLPGGLVLQWRKKSRQRLPTLDEKEKIKQLEKSGGSPEDRRKIEEIKKARETRVHGNTPGSRSVYDIRRALVATLFKKLRRSARTTIRSVQEPSSKTLKAFERAAKENISSRLSKGGLSNDELAKIIKEVRPPSEAPRAGRNMKISWIYFGDLIDAALEIVRTDAEKQLGLDIWRSPNYDSAGNPDLTDFGGPVKVILGDITYFDPISAKRQTISLMDLPISLDLFKEFWLNHVVKQTRKQYSFQAFLRDAMNELVVASMTNKCAMSGEPVVGIRSHIIQASVPNTGHGNKRSVYAARPVGGYVKGPSGTRGADRAWLARINNLLIAEPMNEPHPTYNNIPQNMRKQVPGASSGRQTHLAMNKDDLNKRQEIIYVCATTDKIVSILNGDKKKDVENGILYLEVGTDGTPVETINFNKQNMPWYLEAKGERSGFKDDPIELSEVYNCSFTIYGNTMIKPGQYICIRLPHFGSPFVKKSPAQRLGMGGYFFITKVRNSLVLSGNKFDWITDVNCIWNSFGANDTLDKGTFIAAY